MQPSPEPKKLSPALVPEVISDEPETTAMVQVKRGRPPLVKTEKPRDALQREGFEFYISLGDKRTIDQVAKKLKVPVSLVETWRKEYFWDIDLPLFIRFGSIDAVEAEVLKYVKLGIAEFTMPAPPGSIPAAPLKKRFIDLGHGPTEIPENVVINPVKASSKKAQEFMGIVRDIQKNAIERRDKKVEILGARETQEDESGKGPKSAIQVNVTIIKS